MNEGNRTGRATTVQATCHAAAAAVALAIGILPWIGMPCENCAVGPVALSLPWVGAAFHAGLASLARTRPRWPLMPSAVALSIFVHADLALEGVRTARACGGCWAVALFAFAAAVSRAVAFPAERSSLLVWGLLGTLAGWAAPYERAEFLLDRWLFPSRRLNSLPAVVSRDEVRSCHHSSTVRLLVHEKNCRSCSGAVRRLLPALRAEFGDRLCVHLHEVDSPPPGTILPVYVVAGSGLRWVTIEGRPSPEDLSTIIRSIMDGGETDRPRLEPPQVRGASSTRPVDLLKILMVEEDGVSGAWRRDTGGLVSPAATAFARMYLPCLPPEEYDLTLVVERLEGENSFNIGLVTGGGQVLVAFDGWEGGEYGGLDMVGGEPFFRNESTFKRRVLLKGARRTLRCAVRRSGLQVRVDDEAPLIRTSGVERFSIYSGWSVAEKRALFLGTWSSAFRIHEAVLVPISGPSQLFR